VKKTTPRRDPTRASALREQAPQAYQISLASANLLPEIACPRREDVKDAPPQHVDGDAEAAPAIKFRGLYWRRIGAGLMAPGLALPATAGEPAENSFAKSLL
jgi:hypothetical protein